MPESKMGDESLHGVMVHLHNGVFFTTLFMASLMVGSTWGIWMNGAELYCLWLESDSLAAQADALLAGTYQQIDPRMATFICAYFVGLQYDFRDALQAKSCEREVFLQLIISKMCDLVYDIQSRITQAETVNAFQTTCQTLE